MIDVNDLQYTYPGKKEPTIKGISLTIEKGEVFGYLGPSGAGKSTIQKILIGILTEDPAYLLSLVGLDSKDKSRVASYSKGMKMRLNLCRALLNMPEIIFLDEPTSGLDPVNAKKVKEIILQKKAEGKTIINTTHYMNVEGEICDRVAFIVDGKISLIDFPRELKLNKGQKQVQVEYIENNHVYFREFDLRGLGANQRFIAMLQNKEIQTIHTQKEERKCPILVYLSNM